MTGANEATIAAYAIASDTYVAANISAPPWLLLFMDRLAELVSPGAKILEVGSGPGRDALLLEDRGFAVHRTDATAAFVERMRSEGHDADLLNVVTDDLGGPWAAIYANAVFLHLDPAQFATALTKALAATKLLAFTVKEGDGSAWSTAKIGVPRFFQYWRESELRSLLAQTGWDVLEIARAVGRADDWLMVLAQPSRASDQLSTVRIPATPHETMAS